MKLFLLLLMICITSCDSISQSTNEKHNIYSAEVSIEVKRNPLKKVVELYLKDNNVSVDSISIVDFDFNFDSLTQINDSVWSFIYSTSKLKSANLDRNKEILIGESNKKINIVYVGESFCGFLPKNKKEEEYYYYLKYQVLLNDSVIGPHVKCIDFIKNLEEKITPHKDSLTIITKLKYDAQKKIYFTNTINLNGDYDFWPKDQQSEGGLDARKIKFDNEVFFAIEVHNRSYIYYRNEWLELKYNKTTLVPYFGVANEAKR